MLSVTNANGDALSGVQEISVSGSETGAKYNLVFKVVETDVSLTLKKVSAVIVWHNSNGSVFNTETISPAVSPLIVDKTRSLRPGVYLINVFARNYRQPPDQVVLTFKVSVIIAAPEGEPPKYVFGPILPMDGGSPSAADWKFDIGSDVKILESSVKMLLVTARGERLMQPDYGTDLRRFLFEIDTKSMDGMIQEELSTALARWEPRVGLRSVSVVRPSRGLIRVNLEVVSKLTQQPFSTSVDFASA